MLSAVVHAQGTPDALTGPRPSVWIEPRVSAGVTLSNNGALASANPQSEQVLEVSPGVRMVFNGPSLQGYVDYAISGLYFAQSTTGDSVRQSLSANGTVNAWDNRAFVDVSGSIADQAVSAFGPQVGSLADVNRSETASFRFSPHVRGSFGDSADYELRYGLQSVNTQADTRSDVTVQDLSLKLGSASPGQAIGWSLDALSQAVDYSLGRDTRSDSLGAGLIFVLSTQLRATVRAGVESNDVLTVSRESYNTTGLDLEWRPSPRTRVFLGWEDRYFGNGQNIALEHRTSRTVWRYTDTRGVVSTPLDSASASLGSVYDLLDNLYASTEPDPIRRAQLVQAELLRLGLPADTEVFQNFLTSSATVDRSQELSLALVGIRSVVTFAFSRNDSRRLESLISLGDDFENNSRIQRQGWSIILAHRLTPLTSISARLGSQKTQGTGLAVTTNETSSLALGLTTRLAPRTSGTLQLRRTLFESATNPYGETAISGLLIYRF